jgi:O-antigen/teichoic acid export membrane protein
MSKEKSLTYILSWQLIGKFCLEGIGVITVPIFTRLLTPSDYGFIAIYNAWYNFVFLFIGLKTYSSIANAKMIYANNKMDGYLSSIMTISVVSFIIVLIIGVIGNKIFSSFLGLRNDLIILLIIQSFSSFCILFYTTKLIRYNQAERNVLLSLFVSISSAGSSIIFVNIIEENRSIVKIYANAIPIIVIGFSIVLYIYIKGRKIYDKYYWKYCISFVSPLILHGFGALLIAQSDRIMLQKMVGEESVGIYSFSHTVVGILAAIIAVFDKTWLSFYYETKKKSQEELGIVRAKEYIVIFSIITAGFLLLVREVYKIFSPKEYWQGIVLVPFMALSYYFLFLYTFPITYEYFHGKTKLIPMGTFGAAIINIIGNFILIPRYAEIGAAIATLISYMFWFFFQEFVARFIIKSYEYKLSMYLKGLIPVVAVSVLFYFIEELQYLRWMCAICLGIYLLYRVSKNKKII